MVVGGAVWLYFFVVSEFMYSILLRIREESLGYRINELPAPSDDERFAALYNLVSLSGLFREVSDS